MLEFVIRQALAPDTWAPLIRLHSHLDDPEARPQSVGEPTTNGEDCRMHKQGMRNNSAGLELYLTEHCALSITEQHG